MCGTRLGDRLSTEVLEEVETEFEEAVILERVAARYCCWLDLLCCLCRFEARESGSVQSLVGGLRFLVREKESVAEGMLEMMLEDEVARI